MGMIFTLYSATEPEAARLTAEPDTIGDYFGSRDFGETGLSLEKAWHGLHYVLSGDAWGGDGPLAFILAGGEPIGEDLGYGPARLLSAADVLAVANALEGLTDAEFDQRFDLDALATADIYPSIWDEERDELFDEYRSYFHQLRDFTRAAARKGESLVLVMS